MRIAADVQIPMVAKACRALGDVALFDVRDREGMRMALKGANALLCRSTVIVDAGLLADSNVTFVGTATSGTDHINSKWLAEKGIQVASAAGSNARSVAEYVASSILELFARFERSVTGASVGIIGAGYTGTMTARLCSALGMQVLLHDPPLEDQGDERHFVSLQEILQCDVVTVHVPLTTTGEYPTIGLLNEPRLRQLGSDAILIQASRGGVIEESVLPSLRSEGHLAGLVLDVFVGEPFVDAALVDCASLATPHIAGHSWDGKLRGTDYIVRALHEYVGRIDEWQPVTPESENVHLSAVIVDGEAMESSMLRVLRQAYDIRTDAAAMLAWLDSPASIPEQFTAYRSSYRRRREFTHYTVLSDAYPGHLLHLLRDLGFNVLDLGD